MKLGIVLAFVCLAGCLKGYPTEDEPITSPFDMTQSGRLDAMNRLGGDVWRYGLRSGCTLEVGRSRLRGGQQLALAGADIDLRFDKAEGHYVIEVAQGTDARMAAFYTTPKWADALTMRLLAKVVQMECGS